MKKNSCTWDFFIAHAHDDKAVAEEIGQLLSRHSNVFLDSHQLLLGDKWDQKIAQAQRESLISVIIVSNCTDKAYYEREEIAAAIAMATEDEDRHRVVPIFLDAPSNIPYGLRLIHGIQVCTTDGFSHASQLLLDLLDRLTSEIAPPLHLDVRSKAAGEPRRSSNQPRGHNGPAIPRDVHPDHLLLSQIAQQLPASRGAVIMGPSGSGKTTTAFSFVCSETFARPFRERWYIDCRQPDIPSVSHLDDSSIVVFDQVSAGHPCLTGSEKAASIRNCRAITIVVADDEATAKVALGILKLRSSIEPEPIVISPLSCEAWEQKLACFSECHDDMWPERSWNLFEGRPRFLSWLLQLEAGCQDSAQVERETKIDSQVALLSSWCDLHEGPLLEAIAALVTLPFIGMSMSALAHVLNLNIDTVTNLVQKLGDEGILVANFSKEQDNDPLLMVHDLFRRILIARPQYPDLETTWRSLYANWLATVNHDAQGAPLSVMARLDAWIAGMYEIFQAPREEFLTRLRRHCEQLDLLTTETAGTSTHQRFVRNAMQLNGKLLSQLKRKLEERDESGEYVVTCQPLIGFYKAAARSLQPSMELARIVFAGAMRDDAYVSFQAISNAATIWNRRGSSVAKNEGYRSITNWFQQTAKLWGGSKRHIDHDYAAAFGALRLLSPHEDDSEFPDKILRLREQYCIEGVGPLTHLVLLVTLGDLADRSKLEAYLDQYDHRKDAGLKLILRLAGTHEELVLEPVSFYVEKYLRSKYPDLSLRWWPPPGNIIEVDAKGRITERESWLGDISTMATLSNSREFIAFLHKELGSLGSGL
ncbi:MAG TPA: toll/interleukin-1 receptor domain-containing protein [Pyrinomonadaceae bacterium]